MFCIHHSIIKEYSLSLSFSQKLSLNPSHACKYTYISSWLNAYIESLLMHVKSPKHSLLPIYVKIPKTIQSFFLFSDVFFFNEPKKSEFDKKREENFMNLIVSCWTYSYPYHISTWEYWDTLYDNLFPFVFYCWYVHFSAS